MKYWEFLIQKEGDETWLPLETHQVEVLEGRYRVVAHTDRTNTSVDIRVSQLMAAEGPPRQRVRTRTSQTNDAGLVVVIPYVHLTPGQWDLTCSSRNTAADLDNWQYAVQLQVFAPVEGHWSADWPTLGEAEIAEADTAPVGSSSQPESLVPVNSDLPLTQAQVSQSVETEAGYGIFLRQYAFLAQADQPMVIVGQVQALTDLPINLSADQGESQLWLRLQNPETAQVIMEAHRPINLTRLPADFKVKIQLPAHVTTRVVFGEVSLRAPSGHEASDTGITGTAAAKTAASGTLLCSTAFTITAGIARLLNEIANSDLSEFENEGAVLSASDGAGYTNESMSENVLLPLAIPLLETNAQSASPAVGVVLPPQLYYPTEPTTEQTASQAAGTSSPGRIDLPSFPSSHPLVVSDPPKDRPLLDRSPMEPESTETMGANEEIAAPESSEPTEPKAVKLPPLIAKPAQFMSTSIENDDLETAQIAALLEDIDSDLETINPPSEPSVASRTSRFLSTTPETSDDPPEEAASSAEADNLYPERVQKQASAKAAFRTLRLKDHFMQRLSSLTHDEINQTTKFAEDLQAAGVSSDGSQASTQSDVLDNSEVVIFDEPSAAEEDIPTALSEPTPSVPPVSAPFVPAPSVPAPLPTPLPQPRRQRQSYPQGQPQSQSQTEIPNTEIQPDNVPNQPLSSIPSQSLYQSLSQPLSGTPSQSPLSPPAANQSTIPLSDADRNRQLRLERLRQRQEARAAHAEQLLRSVEPVVQPPTALDSSSALVRQPSVSDELPEMVLPIISVPMGDLIAGDRVTITVRTRPSVFKPFIKLWMIDRQSRTVIGEPKLLTDLWPDALGDLQTSTELLVPMDCLDVQIAVIAIDMATQQESNKAIVNRHVIPPVQSLPPLRSFQEREWYS